MRGLDSGQSYIVTRNGVPVGELRPIRRRQFVDKSLAQAAFAHVRALDGIRFRNDLDRIVSQEPDPRA